MPGLFIGVYVALYAYEARSDQELTVAPNDILYLLEKSTEDDWWKVKKRIVGNAADEPTGLVPNNYIEKANVIDHATALYDYDRQTEEELSFSEGVKFDVYDKSDQDWILVGEPATDQYGFVPSNYIEYTSAAPTPVIQANSTAPPVQSDVSAIGYGSKQNSFSGSSEKPLPGFPPQKDRQASVVTDDDEPPPMPKRPVGNDREERASDGSNGQFFSWPVQEVDGRKKTKATFAIGNGSIMYSPEKSGSEPQQWDSRDMVNYSSEKKHVFLEFVRPTASLDLLAASKDNAEEIVHVLSEIAGANRSAGLREVLIASQSAGRKMGKVLYDFTAQEEEEVSAKEGENVFILDDKSSKEWWAVRTASGQEGVMPATYIEIAAEPKDSKRFSLSFKKKSSSSISRNSSKRVSRRKSSARAESPDDRTRGHATRSKPDMAKVRTWTDRSGTFKVEAELLGCADGKIHLHKLNGVQIAVAASKMSVDDLEYVERVTGAKLDDDRPLVDIRNQKRRSKSEGPTNGSHNTGVPGGVSTGVSKATGSTASLASAMDNRKNSASEKTDYDWFAFFLDCGVDVNNCQRYALNFTRDQMDESILPEINSTVLRNLGLKEGDILRVTKKLDEKYHRNEPAATNNGGLFSAPGGALFNNTTRPAAGSSQNSLAATQQTGSGVSSTSSLVNKKKGFDDDAWAIKGEKPSNQPARSEQPVESAPQTQAKQVKPVAPAVTGSLRDLMTIQPLQPEKTAQSSIADQQYRQQQLEMQRNTQTQIELLQKQQVQQQQLIGKLQQQNTQNQLQQQQLVAQLTGGGSNANPFNNPIARQMTGGGQPLTSNLTGPSALGPFATGNSMPLAMNTTGNRFIAPMAATTTGNNTMMPMNMPGLPTMNPTGGIMTNNMTGGGFNAGGMTGGMTGNGMSNMVGIPTTMTGNVLPMNTTSNGFNAPFGQFTQSTPNFQTFNTSTSTVSNPFMMQNPNQPMYGTSMNNLANQFQQTNLGQVQQPQQQPTGYGFNNQPTPQPLHVQSTGFGFGNSFGAMGGSTFGDMSQNSQKTDIHPPVSFGGPQPLQSTPTGNRRANLAAATPNNPFGF